VYSLTFRICVMLP